MNNENNNVIEQERVTVKKLVTEGANGLSNGTTADDTTSTDCLSVSENGVMASHGTSHTKDTHNGEASQAECIAEKINNLHVSYGAVSSLTSSGRSCGISYWYCPRLYSLFKH